MRIPRLLPLRPESDALLHLDLLRLIAALAIVLVHFRTNLLAGLGDSRTLFVRLDGLATGVDLFFLISGFVIAWVYGDRIATPVAYGRFLRKRVARLGPLHWATLAFFVVIGLVSARLGVVSGRPEKYAWDCLAANAALIHAWGTCGGPSFNTVSWSISAEMAMYLVYPLLFLCVARRPILVALGIGVLVLILQSVDWRPFWVERTYDLGVIRALPGFCLGLLLFRWRDRLARIPYASWLLAGSGLLFVGAMLIGLGKGWLVLIAYAVGALGIAADLSRPDRPPPRWLWLGAAGGRLTYSIYMLHPLVQSVFIVLIGIKLMKLDGVVLSAWTLAAFPLTLLAGYLSLCLFEEPLRRSLGGGRRAKSEQAQEPG